MKKIPTLFLRDADNPKYVTREPHPNCLEVTDERLTILWSRGLCDREIAECEGLSKGYVRLRRQILGLKGHGRDGCGGVTVDTNDPSPEELARRVAELRRDKGLPEAEYV